MRMRRWAVAASLAVVLVPRPEPAHAETSAEATQTSICLMLESAARAYDLPLEFFARLIWRESRFRSETVGPRTRSGARARGIAQFMPATAAERQLLDPFDPVQALPKAAEFLQQLRSRFGNLGLAAAAYNAGPRRVQEWLNGTGAMPQETRSYVLAITGRSVDDWSVAKSDFGPTQPFGCREMMALLKEEPTPYIAALERRVVLGTAKPWGVQLAAGFSRDNALAAYARTMKRFSGLIDQHDPIVRSLVLRSRGTRPFYQIRIGAGTRPEANALCERIRKAGGACMVLRQADAARPPRIESRLPPPRQSSESS